MTGNQYLDTLLDTAAFLPPQRSHAFAYVPALPLCDAAKQAAQSAFPDALRGWLGGMAEGFRGVYASDGRQFARALGRAAEDCPRPAAYAAAARAFSVRERSLSRVIREAYAAAFGAQPDDVITRTLGCFARRWTQ